MNSGVVGKAPSDAAVADGATGTPEAVVLPEEDEPGAGVTVIN